MDYKSDIKKSAEAYVKISQNVREENDSKMEKGDFKNIHYSMIRSFIKKNHPGYKDLSYTGVHNFIKEHGRNN